MQQPCEPVWKCTVTPVEPWHDSKDTMAELKLSLSNSIFVTQPSLFICVVDASGSMSGGPYGQVRAALIHIAGMARLNAQVRLIMLAYADNSVVLNRPEDYVIMGGTNFRAAFAGIKQILESIDKTSIGSASIAFLTDGQDCSGDRPTLIPGLREMIHTAWQQHTSAPLYIHTIGFSRDCDRELLENMRMSGTLEGMFRFAEPTDDHDALCQKLMGIFELCSRGSAVSLRLKWNDETRDVQFPINSQKYGEYLQWISTTPNAPSAVQVTLLVDEEEMETVDVIPSFLEPNEFVRQRWLDHLTDELAQKIIDISKSMTTASSLIRQLCVSILRHRVETIAAKSTNPNTLQRLQALEQQVDEFALGREVNLGKLSDLRFGSAFATTTTVSRIFSTSTIVQNKQPPALLPPVKKEKPLKRYSYNSVGKNRNRLQELLMQQRCDDVSDDLKEVIENSTVEDVMYEDIDGNNAIMLAAYAGLSKALQTLLTRHPNLSIGKFNADEENAVTLAIKKRGFHHTLRVLLDAGCSIPRKDRLERFAVENKYTVTADLIGNFSNDDADSIVVDASMTPDYIVFAYNRAKKKKSVIDVPQFLEVALEKKMTTFVNFLFAEEKIQPSAKAVAAHCIARKPDSDDTTICLELLTVCLNACPDLVSQRIEETNDSLLIVAAQRGILSAVQILLERGAPLDDCNAKGNSAFWVACFAGHLPVAQYLADRGADIHRRNEKGNAPLYGPCTRGGKNMAEFLISRGADVEAVNENGDTFILLCCRNGQHEVLEFLLNYVDAEFVNRVAHIDGFNALMASAEQDRGECIRVLHNYGIDLNQRTATDNAILADATPLHLCSYYGRGNAMRVLLQLKADVNAWDKNKQTPLHIAAIQGHVDLVRLLRQHGADINAVDQMGNIPLAYCRNRADVRKALVHPMLDVLLVLARGQCSKEDYIGACSLLTELVQEDVCTMDMTDKDGSTVLMLATIHGQVDLIHVLVCKGCDPGKRNKFGLSAWDWATWTKNKRIQKLLLQNQQTVISSPSYDRLLQLSPAHRVLLFLPPQPPSQYTVAVSSGLSQRMNAFINTPVPFEDHFTAPVTENMLLLEWVTKTTSSEPDLSHRLWDAKVHVLQLISANSNLSAPDLLTLSLYTNNSTLALRINQAILTNDLDMKLATSLMESLRAVPPFEGEVFLGCNTSVRKQFTKGTEFTWRHFVSASTLWKVALEETPQFTTKARLGTILAIQSKTGRYVAPYSMFSFDGEVVFLPCTKFRVTNWYHGDEIALGQRNIREHTFGIKETDQERMNLDQMLDSEKSLIIEITEL